MNIKLISTMLTTATIISSLLIGCGSEGSGSADSSAQNTGTSGSMARFQIIDNYLYTISDSWNMTLFDISNPARPSSWRRINMPNGIETLYQYNNYLFVGANNGIHIFDNSDPSAPFFVSSFSHVQSCDPVVVENGYAYATLRGGTRCRSNINQLDVIDVSNILQPTLMNSIPMLNPKGLGIKNGKLFVCDENTLVSYDASDPVFLKEIDRLSLYDCFDVIPSQNKLIVSHGGGISQYDFATIPVTLISDIALLQ